LASAVDGAGGVAAGGAAAGGAELMKQDGSVDVSVTERSMAGLQEVLRNKSDRCRAYTDGCPRICTSVYTYSLMRRLSTRLKHLCQTCSADKCHIAKPVDCGLYPASFTCRSE
jgi:hypothetical protein